MCVAGGDGQICCWRATIALTAHRHQEESHLTPFGWSDESRITNLHTGKRPNILRCMKDLHAASAVLWAAALNCRRRELS